MIDAKILATKLIKQFEGCQLTAYWDATGKVWTIGFGHTDGVKQGDVITIGEAVGFLAQDIDPLFEMVKERNIVEAAALISFGFNCGAGALKRVLSGSIKVAEGRFLAGGVPYGEVSGGVRLQGLVNRRQLEASLIEAVRG
jgi:lysozyme